MQVLILGCCQFFFLSVLVAPLLPEFNIDWVMSLLFWRENKEAFCYQGEKKKRRRKKKIEPVRETVILLPWEPLQCIAILSVERNVKIVFLIQMEGEGQCWTKQHKDVLKKKKSFLKFLED